MTNEENGTTQQPSEQAPVSPAGGNDAGVSAPKGLVAGPLRMGIAGLLAGIVVWQIMHWTYPYFEIPEVPVKNERDPTPDEVLQMDIATMETIRRDTVVVGIIIGGLAALAFALVEGFSQGGVVRTLAISVVGVVLGGGLGAVGGYLSVSFQSAYRLDDALAPMALTIGTQGIFWGLMALGIGLGVAPLAGRVLLAANVLLQAILAAVLFVFVYVPAAGLLFPRERSDWTIPVSSGNIAVWVVSALVLMGFILGMSRPRPKKVRGSSPE